MQVDRENEAVGQENPLMGLRVLVADDSATVRRGAQSALADLGCECLVAVDGLDALAKVADLNPRLVLLDIMMPRLDGYATCQLLKRNPRYRDIPVVIVSGNDSVFDRACGLLSGADDFLVKPFTQASLLRCLADGRAGGLLSKAETSSSSNHGH